MTGIDIDPPGDLEVMARSLLDAYVSGGVVADLDRALDLYRQVRAAGSGRTSPDALVGYATALLEHYKLRPEPSSLATAIEMAESRLVVPGLEEALRVKALLVLAQSLHARHLQFSDFSDLLRATDIAKQAVTLVREDSPDRWDCADAAIGILWAHYDVFHDPAVLPTLGVLYEEISGGGPMDRHRPNQCSYLWAAHVAGVGAVGLDEVIDAHRALLAEQEDIVASRDDFVFNYASALRKRAAAAGVRRGDELKAIKELYEAVLKRQPAGTPSRWRNWRALAEVTYEVFAVDGDPQELEQAIVYGEAALREADEEADDFVTLLLQQSHFLMARARMHPGPWPESEERARAIELTSRAAGRARTGTPERGLALHELTFLLAEEHHNDQRPESLDAVITAAEELVAVTPFDSPNLAIAYHTLAAHLISRDALGGTGMDLERAIAVTDRCVTLLERSGRPSSGMLGIQGEAMLRRFVRTQDSADLSAVIASHEAALATGPNVPHVVEEITENLAQAYWSRYHKDHDPADLDYAVTWYESKVRDQEGLNRAGKLAMLAHVLRERYEARNTPQDLDAAIEYLLQAQEMPAHSELDRRGNLSNLAQFLQSRYERDHSEQDLYKAVDILTELVAEVTPESPGYAQLLDNLGSALQTAYHATQDVSFLMRAVEAWSAAWDVLQATFADLSASFKYGQETTWSVMHGKLVSALVDAADLVPSQSDSLLRRALVVAESAKSKVLADQMSRLDVVTPAVLSDLVEQERALINEIRQLDAADLQRLGTPEHAREPRPEGGFPTARQGVVEELKRVWATMEATGGEVGKRFVASRKGSPWTWEDAQAAAERTGGALVSLFVTKESSIVFVHEPGRTAPVAVRLALTTRHWARARTLLDREVIQGTHSGRITETWHRAIVTACEPLVSYLADTSRVAFAPMGDAHMLPWPILFHRMTEGEGSPPVVTVLPTLTVLDRLQNRDPAPGARSALVVGNPRNNLPHAAKEARAVASALNTSALVGPEATVARVREGFVGAEVVHLATHAEFAAGAPYDSSLELADDQLSVGDIAGLRIDARLVVLSACETAVADVGGGDSLTGLAQAFLQAGALGLVVSLWRVDDSATAELMTRFHEGRLAGAGGAEALHSAMHTLRESSGRNSPYFWGAFIYIGL